MHIDRPTHILWSCAHGRNSARAALDPGVFQRRVSHRQPGKKATDEETNRVEWYLLGSALENNSCPWCSWQLQSNIATLSYERRADFPAAMTLEMSTDLTSWSEAVGTPELLPLDTSGLRERVK